MHLILAIMQSLFVAGFCEQSYLEEILKSLKGPRFGGRENQDKAITADNITTQFNALGLDTSTQHFTTDHNIGGRNVIGALYGTRMFPSRLPDAEHLKIYALVAHYDTARNSSGGDDNGSGVAVLLDVARRMTEKAARCERRDSVVFVALDFGAFSNASEACNRYCGVEALVDSEFFVKYQKFIAGVVFLDAVGNVNTSAGSQFLPESLKESDLYKGVTSRGFRGDFILATGRQQDFALLQRFSQSWKAAGSKTYSVEEYASPSPSASIFSRSMAFLWSRNFSAITITDTVDWRGYMKDCVDQICDDTSRLLRDENLSFMQSVSSSLEHDVSALVSETCGTLDEHSQSLENLLRERFSGPRDRSSPDSLNDTRAFIRAQFEAFGMTVYAQTYGVPFPDQEEGVNIIGMIPGCAAINNQRLFIVGTHYDTVSGTTGFDDNGSGMAALIQAANLTMQKYRREGPFKNPVIFVAFDNEEDGFLGSLAFLKQLTDDGLSRVTGSLILDTVLNYNEENDTQHLPDNFDLAFPEEVRQLARIGNKGTNLVVVSRDLDVATDSLLAKVAPRDLFLMPLRISTKDFPSGRPSDWRQGRMQELLRSDHYEFWEANVTSVLLTDTADFRGLMSHCYHRSCDNRAQYSYKSYAFLSRVARLVADTVLSHAEKCDSAPGVAAAKHPSLALFFLALLLLCCLLL